MSAPDDPATAADRFRREVRAAAGGGARISEESKAQIRAWLEELAAKPPPLAAVVTLAGPEGERTVEVDRIEALPDGRLKLHGRAAWADRRVVLTATIAAPGATEPPGMPYFCGDLGCPWSGTAAEASTPHGYRCPTCGAVAEPVF